MNNKRRVVIQALKEDIGSGDISSALITHKNVNAKVVCLDKAVISGIDYFDLCFYEIDSDIEINWHIKEGDLIPTKKIICSISGNSKTIISAERTALNFLQTFSSSATKTRNIVDLIAHTKAKLLDTRKTIPNLRQGQKQAVKSGLGFNHRMGLYDCVMLKENHILATSSLEEAVAKSLRIFPDKDIIIEVESLEQLEKVLKIKGVTRILCDNFSVEKLAKAVKISGGLCSLEASGLIDADNIKSYAETGVDYISIGDITKNIKAIDLSLKIY